MEQKQGHCKLLHQSSQLPLWQQGEPQVRRCPGRVGGAGTGGERARQGPGPRETLAVAAEEPSFRNELGLLRGPHISCYGHLF